ncbi:MAG: DUF2726 domain-containing protein [Planctomycetota bacterium]
MLKDHERYAYKPVDNLLTPTERDFVGVLQKCIPPKTTLFVKVRLADIVNVCDDEPNFTGAFNLIKSKHVDYVLANSRLRPILVIELDDPSHRRKKAQRNDAVKDYALAAAAIPLLRVETEHQYDKTAIRKSIARILAPLNTINSTGRRRACQLTRVDLAAAEPQPEKADNARAVNKTETKKDAS